MKQSWNLINSLTGRSKNSSNFENSLDNEALLDRVENFNDFFSNIGNLLGSRFNETDYNVSDSDFSNNASFFLCPVTECEIDEIIVNMKVVKSDINVIPVNIFKTLRHIFIPPLIKLVNLSFETGIFPDSLKIARVTPIHKQGNNSDPSNFRPISSLPYLSKIFEKCVKDRLISFFDRFSLFCPTQFGFRRGMSTCDAMVHLTEQIYNSLDNRSHTFAILIDFKKAFDTVNHGILLKKLQSYGIRGTQLEWFRSYLLDRKCYVEIQNVKSSVRSIDIGVPQGSILGPILFLLYINKFSKLSNQFDTTLFADDTTVLISNHDFNSLVSNSNFVLGKINDWTINNRLTLNVSKTVALYFSNRGSNGDQNIVLGGESVSVVNNCKFLGVFLDNRLNFVSHIQYIYNKISKHSGILYRIKNNLTLEAKLSYYYAFIYPYLSYNVCVWGSTYSTHLQPLVIQQKRIIRILTDSHFLAHTRPLFYQLGLLQFIDIYKFSLLCYVHNLISKGKLSFNRARSLRDPYLLKPSLHKLTLTQHAFSFMGPNEWNKLPINLRKIEKLPKFKRNLKKYFLDSYSD